LNSDQLGNKDEEKLLVASDLEAILTFYCKSRSVVYEQDNGWTSVLKLLLALKYSKAELYNTFYAVVTKYIPKWVYFMASAQ
jgi:TBC1 domain family member 23